MNNEKLTTHRINYENGDHSINEDDAEEMSIVFHKENLESIDIALNEASEYEDTSEYEYNF